MAIKVIVNGAYGRMGVETVKALQAADDLICVGQCGRGDNIIDRARETGAQVVVDFTLPDVIYDHSLRYIDAGLCPVIGATGLTAAQISKLQALAKKNQLGGMIAPNFSIAVVLLMQFAAQAVKYYPETEIIEMHHQQKQDAPSGTAVKAAAMMAQARLKIPTPDKAFSANARGETIQDIKVHAIRLPGCVAHLEVLFGGPGELLRLRHDTLHRESFMPGVLLACRQVVKQTELFYGLEHLLPKT